MDDAWVRVEDKANGQSSRPHTKEQTKAGRARESGVISIRRRSEGFAARRRERRGGARDAGQAKPKSHVLVWPGARGQRTPPEASSNPYPTLVQPQSIPPPPPTRSSQPTHNHHSLYIVSFSRPPPSHAHDSDFRSAFDRSHSQSLITLVSIIIIIPDPH